VGILGPEFPECVDVRPRPDNDLGMERPTKTWTVQRSHSKGKQVMKFAEKIVISSTLLM
jgi:hypothetical protein